MIELKQVTLLCLATRDIEASGKALEYSCRSISFARVLLISPYRPAGLAEFIEWEYIVPFPSIDNWNRYIVFDLWKHFSTDFCFLAHSDGFIVNPESWKEEFLHYDYIGSPWDLECANAIRGPRTETHELVRVGNSVGIRSHKISRLPTEIGMPWVPYNNDYNEDTQLCAHNRYLFLQYGIKYAPIELAVEFGREAEIPENTHIEKPFCFHKWTGRNNQYPRF